VSRTLVGVLGWASVPDTWTRLQEALGITEARLMELDEGQSAEGWSLAAAAARVAALVRELGDRPVLLVGHSVGAMAALAASTEAGLNVAGVVGLAPSARAVTAPGYPLGVPAEAVAGMLAFVRKGVGEALAALAPDLWWSGAAPAALLEQLVAGMASKDPALEAVLLERVMSADLRPWLPAIGRGLLLSGDRDQVAPPAASRFMADLNPGLTARTVPGAGHYLHWEEPEAVARAIEEFVGPGW
jgi:2-succinyl-6-hydroxy-2,4-cyclohexadiene-1-carboxylate synthase